jgi:glycosyltransferase involved in cell wall biosynthesis
MNLALLFHLPPTRHASQGPRFGAPFVSNEFLWALFRYAPYEQFAFFLPSMFGADETLSDLSDQFGGDDRFTAHHLAELPEVLTEMPIQALHTIGASLYAATHARSLVPGARFPVTCSVMDSPSYISALGAHVQDLLGPHLPGDRLVVYSEAAREAFAGLRAHLQATTLAGIGVPVGPPASTVIPLGIDTERYARRPGGDWRERLDVPAGAFLVTGVGRFSPIDKADLLPVLNGFYQLLQQDDGAKRPIHLVLAGSDYWRYGVTLKERAVRLGIADRVHLLPDLDEDDKLSLLSDADCFLALPDNPQEAFGYSVLEAMACGLPVVASDWNGLKETVTPDVGFRVPTYWGPANARLDQISALFGSSSQYLLHLLAAQSVAVDVEQAWQRVRELRDDPDLQARMAKAARERVESVYAWPKVIGRYVTLWEESARLNAEATAPERPSPAWTTAFQSAFRHYPSQWLGAETRLVRTRLGESLPSSVVVAPYPDLTGLFSNELFAGLMAELLEPCSIGDLIDASGADADLVYGHVLWLLKQGLIRVT